MCALSALEKIRTEYQPKLPAIFEHLDSLTFSVGEVLELEKSSKEELLRLFPNAPSLNHLNLQKSEKKSHKKLILGVVLSGGQAPGGHTVICSLFDALKKLNQESQLIGFLEGPEGIINNQWIELTYDYLKEFRNQGGFHMIGSGRTKIESEEQFALALKTAQTNNLDGLVVIGGDDSNTNAAILAEYFIKNKCKTKVIGVPKTIDGDLKSKHIETSFGFDTAAKTFSQEIGSILRDAASQKKYTFFIKLMGRSASHITLECALQTHPNLALISEEIAYKKMNFQQVIFEICDLISERANLKKNYGVILIPEGVIEFIPDFKLLIQEINRFLASGEGVDDLIKHLSQESKKCFELIPKALQEQLMMDRDSHGNVQVSKIDTERLFIEACKVELERRTKEGTFKGKFSAQPLFLGYEGRSCLPSNFDSDYSATLGVAAALLIDEGKTSYCVAVQNLRGKAKDWQVGAVPLIALMTIEERKGVKKPVIKKALVDLTGKPFLEFLKIRDELKLKDDYRAPGPIQFFGDEALVDAVTFTL